MYPEISAAAQLFSYRVGREVTSSEIYQVFQETFIRPIGPYQLVGYWPRPDETDPTIIHGEIRILVKGHEQRVIADGNGPISAFVSGLNQLGMENFTLADYHEQAIGKGADAHAIAYVPLKFDTGETVFGVGIATNIDQAAVHAIVAGLNRKDLMRGKHLQSKDWWPFL
jgi:2-isopropylmalate synthase